MLLTWVTSQYSIKIWTPTQLTAKKYSEAALLRCAINRPTPLCCVLLCELSPQHV